MKRLILVIALGAVACGTSNPEIARWEREARNVTITRDDWGIAHVHGTTDAAAVFGMIYAQAEDDFHRVETNYLNAMGRLAEVEALYLEGLMKTHDANEGLAAFLEKRAPKWQNR